MEARTFRIHSNRSKPNRSLMGFNLKEVEEVIGKTCLFEYIVKFNRPQVVAGNHYHERKIELLVCIIGSVFVKLENPKTGEAMELHLHDEVKKADNAIIIPPGCAHAVVSHGPNRNAVLLVFSTGNPREEDDIEYEVIPRDEKHIQIREDS